MPADAELTRLADLLGARVPAGGDVADLVRAWLADDGPDGSVPLEDPLGEWEPEPLRRGLGMLAKRQRAAVVLRYWSGLPVAEVAGLLDVPEQTVEQESAAALDVLGVGEERLTDGLAAMAAAVHVPTRAHVAPGTAPRRWRSAGVAAAVLVVAGLFAAVLSGGPADTPRADPDEARPSGIPPTPVVLLPAVENPAPTTDRRARRLTTLLAQARPAVLPGVTELHPAPVSSPTGEVLWAPLTFHVADDAPDLYLAVATMGSGPDAVALKVDVGYRNPDADPRFTPCPEYLLDCTYRRLPDGTYGAVTVFVEPSARRTIHRLTFMRPDGTFGHVSVFYRERRVDPPPFDHDAMFRFATVFTY